MGDYAVWITTVAGVVAAFATGLTAYYLREDRRDRRDADLPILNCFGWRVGDPKMITLVAVNPGQERWMLKSVRCGAKGFEVASASRHPSETDGYGNPSYIFGRKGRSASVNAHIIPAALAANGQQILASIAVYGPDEWPGSLELLADIQSIPRRSRSRRFTATINITD